MLTDQVGASDQAAGTAIADGGFCVDHNRTVCYFSHGCEGLTWNVGHSRAVDSDGRVYDRGIFRQHRHPLSDLGHRQTEEVDEFKLAGQGGDFVLVMLADGLTLPRVTH